MTKKLRCVFDRGILPWERGCFTALFNALAERYSIKVEDLSEGHRKALKRNSNSDEAWWIVSRDWKQTVSYLGARRSKAPVFISVMHLPQDRHALATLFFRQFVPELPENCYLVFHSPINQKFYEAFTRIPQERCLYLPLPVPAFAQEPTVEPPAATVRVGTLCQFVGESQLNHLMLVAHYIRKQRADIKFLIFGSGILYPHFSRVCLDLGLSDVVEVIETQGAYRIADIDILFYAPMRNNSFSTLLMAARLNAAVVATELPGLEDFVDDTKSGFLVPVNEVKPAAELILRLADNQTLRQGMAALYSKNANERFAPDRLAGLYEGALLKGRVQPSARHQAA